MGFDRVFALEKTAISKVLLACTLETKRGKAHASFVVAALTSSFTSPPRRLVDRFIEDVVVIPELPPGAIRAVEYLPDGRAHLVFRFFGGDRADLSVRGPLTRAHYKQTGSLPACVRVTFRPGAAYPFFGVPVNALTDELVWIDDLWGNEGDAVLCDLVRCANARGDVAAAIVNALARRLRETPFEPASAHLARAAVAILSNEAIAVEAVAARLGVSERHLRRAFSATVGYAPKTYARIARFQRALAMSRSEDASWSEIARMNGYCDQAHLSADFRELARHAPTALARSELTSRSDCARRTAR